jgi:hypothetical protein
MTDIDWDGWKKLNQAVSDAVGFVSQGHHLADGVLAKINPHSLQFADVTADKTHDNLIGLFDNDKKQNKWFMKFVDPIFDVAEGLSASYYHLENITRYESVIGHLSLERMPPHVETKPWTMEGGNTRKLDYEYQALIISLKRALDYAAWSISSFLKNRCNSISSFHDQLRTRKKPYDTEIAKKLLKALDDLLPKLYDSVVSSPDKNTTGLTSARDLITHYRALRAGHLGYSKTLQGGVAITLHPRDNNDLLKSTIGGLSQENGFAPASNLNPGELARLSHSILMSATLPKGRVALANPLGPVLQERLAITEQVISKMYDAILS